MKPQIGFDRSEDVFTKNGIPIDDDEALELWNKVGSADWSVGAYNQMVARQLC